MPETAVWTEEMEHSFLTLLLPAFSIPQKKMYETRAGISLNNFTIQYLHHSKAFAYVQTPPSVPKGVSSLKVILGV